MAFFKVPIHRLTDKLPDPMGKGEKVVFNESQQAMIDGLERFRFWVHLSARRTGKSYSASIAALAKLLEPNQQVMVVAPNFNLSSIIWDNINTFIHQLELETAQNNAKERVIKLINGSTFRLLSAANRETLIGRAANLLIVDEAAIIENEEYFNRDLRPVLSTYPDSRVLFITTPRGKANYIYEFYMRGQPNNEFTDPEWGSAKFPWTANPRLSEKDIKAAERTMSKALFRQEYHCDWATFEGQIYSMDEDSHLAQIVGPIVKKNDTRYDYIAGLDMGYRDETVFVVIATNGRQFFVIDYYMTKEASISIIAEEIKRLQTKWGIDNIYIDAAAQQSKADLAYDHDIYCDNAVKSVQDGIKFLQNLVEKKDLLIDKDHARYIFDKVSTYRWHPNSEIEKPIHDDSSHASDALRYAIYSFHMKKASLYAEM